MFLVQIDCYNLLSTHCHCCRPMLLPSSPTAATPFFIVDAITLTSHCHRHTVTIASSLLVSVPFAAAVAMPCCRAIASSLPLSPCCRSLLYRCRQVLIFHHCCVVVSCWCIIATAVAVPSPSCPRCRSHCAASPSPYHWIFIVIFTIVAVFLLPQSPFHHRFVTMSSLPQSPYLVIVTSSLYHCRRDLVVASLLLSHCHLHAIASTPSQLPYYCRRVVVMP